MRLGYGKLLVAALLLLSGLVSCANYVITRPLERDIEPPPTITIGAIDDGLPVNMPADKKPTLEEIANLKTYIFNEMNSNAVFDFLDDYDSTARYEVSGRITEFKRGSGALRFFIGFGLGNARLLMTLEIYDREIGQPIFAGSFKAEVSDWATNGDRIYRNIARDFAKAFRKQHEKLLKNNEA